MQSFFDFDFDFDLDYLPPAEVAGRAPVWFDEAMPADSEKPGN